MKWRGLCICFFFAFCVDANLVLDKGSIGSDGVLRRSGKVVGSDAKEHEVELLPSFLKEEELAAYDKLIASSKFSLQTDSVDELPTHELRLLQAGKRPLKAASALLGKSGIGGRVQTYVRKHMRCKKCVVCESLIRRYHPDERTTHATHFDSNAFVTFVVALTSEVDGGLYVQANNSIASRSFLNLSRGDAVMHQFDLRHGVLVRGGIRYSAIFWLADTSESCEERSTPWYMNAAKQGDPNAQLNVAYKYLSGTEEEHETAVKWLRKAAEQGQEDAQRKLGLLHREGRAGLTKDLDLAEEWLRKAAERGLFRAQTDLAILMLERNPDNGAQAAKWLRESAAQGDHRALVNLGMMLRDGKNGLAQKVDEAAELFRQAATVGDPLAKKILGDMIYFGEISGSKLEAARWYRKAASQGNKKAKGNLEIIKSELNQADRSEL
eukprot:TRINITY_DN23114_c0_g1_i1.p1 TRINITY_DN23114_c0_g1~~TRINITY_DN23114_c0_g1_i1.p1  ORF type:complete len:460 (+),score=58.90 TRINITY_DN23114_c0_g1_i1:67-1380(+)